jgi:hypothetical protein
MVALAAVILVAELARHHSTTESSLLVVLLLAIAFAARWLLRDLRLHPANFPTPTAAQGFRFGGSRALD